MADNFRLERILAICVALAFNTAFLAFGAPAFAQTQTSPGFMQAELTDPLVTAFIASYPDFLKLGDELQQKYGATGGETKSGAESFALYMQYKGALADLDAKARSFGFDGFLNWLSVTNSVSMAYAVLRDGGTGDDQMAKAIQKINEMPKLTNAQKAALIARIQGSTELAAVLRPSQANLDVIAPHMDELKAVLEPAAQ